MKNPWVVLGIIVVVLFGGAILLSNKSAEKNNEGVIVADHVKGNPDAGVVLVEYSDLQCPACAAFAPVVSDTLDQYGDSVRFEYKHFPLYIHPFALNAALAAEAAGQQGKFFEYHDILFERQSQWSNATVPLGFFVSYAEELGLDTDLFRRHMKSTLLRDKVEQDLEAAEGLGLTGTPTFFLNGERMTIQTYQDFIDQIGRAVDPTAVSSTTDATAEPEVTFGL